ncbi:redoxin domain-containing protein [Pedobacter sp. AW31-3R]|uniref:redoxin domain-containing protein n=1 Tax=Pedobacter sp. AW31-3R TaxID=3445781 RepID=UPI003F9F2270
MKKLFIAGLLLFNTALMAQRTPDPKVVALRNEKNPVLLKASLRKLSNGTEDDMKTLVLYFSNDPAKQDSLVEVIIKRFPKGNFAFNRAQNTLFVTSNAAEQESQLKDIIKRFPAEELSQSNYSVAYAYALEKNSAKAVHFAGEIKNAAFKPMAIGIIANEMTKFDLSAAELMVAKELENAKRLMADSAKTKADPLAKPKQAYYDFVTLYGTILMKQGKSAEALTYMTDAFTHADRKNPDLVRHYNYLLSKNGKYEEAFPFLEKTVKNGQADEDLKSELQKAYAALYPGKDVALYMKSMEDTLRIKISAEVAKMEVDETAPDFVITDVNGKKVSLADFKGKTIVLDFWATWCGPCKKSFPTMQIAVDKYKDDPNVKFLFIHTWEKTADPLKDATSYLTENKYRFDLFMDTRDPQTKMNPAVSAFGVKGIPAKFIIDGKGHIRFKVTGFSGGQDAAVEELTAMINRSKLAS